MLTVKQVEAASPHELAYECFNEGHRVGRLVAQLTPDGRLEAVLEEISQREAGRTLVAKLERDARANGLPGLYLLAHDERESAAFLSNGFEPIEEKENALRLYKSFTR
ncbi:MAG: hypothetical protein J0I20_03385 [Chloroflexi bacterium]|nr:hypothetical protein [Chloroflexota bacterium]OJV89204.1 MAG: hypothetical protein BGO39_34960 [Chloroflexi bacterium 54-19]